MKEKLPLILLCIAASACLYSCQIAQVSSPLAIGPVGALPLITGAESRAVTMENPQGLPGQGGKAKGGRKGAPAYSDLKPGETLTMMDIEGCGVIRHIWMTIRPDNDHYRNAILRMYWDGSDIPSVETPVLDFTGQAHGVNRPMYSALTSMTEGRGFNFFFPMPFERGAKITLENDGESTIGSVYFQIDYELMKSLPKDAGRFHAQFRRQNPTTLLQDYVILDQIDDPGVYIGTMIGVRTLGPHWWGEGEMKFYIDNDDEYPTICGTGTEDYFCSAWGLGVYQHLYHGCTLLEDTDDNTRYASLYRWHVTDPIRFKKLHKLTIQQIGWNNGLYERSDDWCSVAFWYQKGINQNKPPLPDRAARSADLTPLWNKGGESSN
ncbi:MAG: DUF2961 domain-containing protein [Candidatus Omnitrophica bacterium]|nr:DUF2961 domain-containing protein [Candidatus Omnitrophota bacterium]